MLDEKNKLNIVCSGGEMKGGFVAGFLKNFFEEIDISNIELHFNCVSASVPTVLYFLSFGKEAPSEIIWINELSKEANKIDNGFLKIDIAKIIDIFKNNPLSKENILNNKHTINISLYNIDKKQIDFFSNKKNANYKWLGDFDLYEIIHAAISAPVYYNNTVELAGNKYCDPGLVRHFNIPDNNYKTIFIVQNKNFLNRKIEFLFLLFYSFINKSKLPFFRFTFHSFHKKKLFKKVKNLIKNKKAILIEPKHNLKGGLNLNFSKKILKFNFKVGQDSFKVNKNKILKFTLN